MKGCSSGMGGSLDTTVRLREASDRSLAVDVFTPDISWRDVDRLKLVWLAPRVLEIVAPSRGAVGIRVAEYQGVEIRVRYDDPADREKWLRWYSATDEWLKRGGTGPRPSMPSSSPSP